MKKITKKRNVWEPNSELFHVTKYVYYVQTLGCYEGWEKQGTWLQGFLGTAWISKGVMLAKRCHYVRTWVLCLWQALEYISALLNLHAGSYKEISCLTIFRISRRHIFWSTWEREKEKKILCILFYHVEVSTLKNLSSFKTQMKWYLDGIIFKFLIVSLERFI